VAGETVTSRRQRATVETFGGQTRNPGALGNTTPVNGFTMIEGTEKTFSGTRVSDTSPTQTNNNLQAKDTQTLAVNFDKLDSIASGSITVTSTFSCNQTENCQRVPTCTATMPFTGRRVTGSNIFSYAGE
jgi:hypothetical protein